jgi:hypothetical protein
MGRTNGLTNGLGRTNGLTNGMGRTNGLTNGLGQTNGMTNGFGPRRMNDQGAVHPKKLSLILIVVFVIVMPVSLGLLIQSQPVPGQVANIDGKFEEWSKFTRYVDTAQYSDAALDITEFSVAADGADFFAYINAHGPLLANARVDRYFAFIDADGSAASGYSALGLGAEYVVEAYGHSAGGWSVSPMRFSGTDQQNWSAFGQIGPGYAESVGTELELRATLDAEIALGGTARIRFASMTGSAMADVCDPIVDGKNGALVVSQAPQDASGIVSGTNLLTLQLRAVGDDVTVNSMATTPAYTLVGFSAGTIAANQAMTVQVTTDVASISAGTLVKASVTSVGVQAATYNVVGKGLAAYANSAPASVAIDGAFADWNSISKTSDAAGDVDNPGIDIVEEAAATQSTNFLAYVKLNGAGQAMSGMAVPQARTVPSGGGGGGGGGGGTAVLPRVAGEDLCRFYIDSVSGGSSIGGISADYVLELRGMNGAILSKNLYTYPARALVASVSAETGAGAIEAGVALASIGSPAGTVRMYVETTDWERNVDTSLSIDTLMSATRGSAMSFVDTPKPIDGPLSTDSHFTCWLGDAPTIDADYVASEWDDADYYYSISEFTVFVKRDSTYFYFCVEDYDDTKVDPVTNQMCEFMWDTDHNEGSTPQTDDMRYEIKYVSGAWATTYYEGTGASWSSTTAPSGAQFVCGRDPNSPYRWIYEGRMPLSALNKNSKFDADGEEIGFAVMVDETGAHKAPWPPTGTSEDNPSTWGDIIFDVPEFPSVAVPIVICAIPLIAFRARRRPRHG